MRALKGGYMKIKSRSGKRVKKRASFFKADERFATKAVTIIGITTAIFITAQYVSFLITGVEQTTLIDNYFNAVECGVMMLKRIAEVVVARVKKKENIETSESEVTENDY